MIITQADKKAKLLVRSGGPDNNNYDILRLMLALAVVLSHATPATLGPGATEPLSSFFHGTSLGDIAVDGFFTISGFLVTASWRKSTPFQFLEKRSARILPGFVVACLVTAGLATATSLNVRQTLGCTNWLSVLITTFTFRRPVVCFAFSANPYPFETNASLWTIKYEVACYVATALLGFAGLLLPKRRFVAASLFVVLCVATILLDRSSMAESLLSYATRLASFYAAGITVYSFRESLRRSWQLIALSLVIILLSSLSRLSSLAALPTAGVYLLFCFVYADRILFPSFKQKVGDLSYGVYLYGWPVAQTLVAMAYIHIRGAGVLAVLSIICTIPIAYLSWHCVEKRFLAMIPRT